MKNELQLLRHIILAKEESDKNFKLGWLIGTYEDNINKELKDIQDKEQELKDALEIINLIKEELNKNN